MNDKITYMDLRDALYESANESAEAHGITIDLHEWMVDEIIKDQTFQDQINNAIWEIMDEWVQGYEGADGSLDRY